MGMLTEGQPQKPMLSTLLNIIKSKKIANIDLALRQYQLHSGWPIAKDIVNNMLRTLHNKQQIVFTPAGLITIRAASTISDAKDDNG